MSRIKMGVIGCGVLGGHHTRLYADNPYVDMVAVYDTNTEQSRALADKYGCAVADSLTTLCQSVDAVTIATPAKNHAFSLGVAAINACHILCEKPLYPQADTAEMMVEVAEDQGVILHVGHTERFNPCTDWLRANKSRPAMYELQRYAKYQRRGTDVSVVMDLMIHDIDLALHLIGRAPTKVVASGDYDNAKAELFFACGSVAKLHANRRANKAQRTVHTINDGKLTELDLQSHKLKAVSIIAGEIVTEEVQLISHNALEEEQNEFILCINGGNRKHATTGIEALTAVQVAQLIEQQTQKQGQ